MAEIITTLHPENDSNTNLYPNIKKENIPNKSIDTNKLDDNVLSLIGSLKPSGTDTSTNILAYTSNKGIYVATDNGHWYYWNGNKYVDGGVYQATDLEDNSVNIVKINNDLILLKDQINANNVREYELGAINNKGDFVESTNRIRIKQPIYLKAGDIVRSYNDILVNIVGYDQYGTLLVTESGYSNYHEVSTNAYYYLVIRKDNNNPISSDEIISIPKYVYAIYKNDPNINNEIQILSNKPTFNSGFVNSYGVVDTLTIEYNQVCTHKILCVNASNDKPIKFTTKNTNEFFIKISNYDKRGNFIDDSGWVTDYTLNKNSLIRITIRTSKNKTGLPRNYSVEDVANAFIIYKVENFKKDIIKDNKKYIHISFDDFYQAFNDITINKDVYKSIYDNSFFALLKEYHETYGAVFSCYCYLTADNYDIDNVTDKFKDEFLNNNDWLKFGLHARNENMNYANETSENATTDYNKFTSNIIRICGSYKSIDVIPRLHNFAGNTASLVAMRDCKCGIKGLLGADDTRQNYNLSSADGSYLFNHERFFDSSTQLHYVTTDIRFERDDVMYIIDSISNGDLTFSNKCLPLITFTHEWIYSSNLDKLRNVLRFGILNDYDFDYPQNREI